MSDETGKRSAPCGHVIPNPAGRGTCWKAHVQEGGGVSHGVTWLKGLFPPGSMGQAAESSRPGTGSGFIPVQQKCDEGGPGSRDRGSPWSSAPPQKDRIFQTPDPVFLSLPHAGILL